ncbi:MAG TPA: hypothetical protein VFR04_09410 [Solirubrobacterales bacterium]|nr:hypothetical protein [Solirubrobacterales bacterium]
MGSGGVPEKAAPTSEGASHATGATPEEPSYTPGSGDYSEAQPSTPSGSEGPASATSGTRSVEPAAPPIDAGRAVEVAVGAAAPLAHAESSQRSSSATPPAAAFTGPADQGGSNSYLLPLLAILALGLLGFAGVRLRHLHERRRLEALRRRQEVAWKASLRQIEVKRAIGALKPSGERLQKLDVG